MKIVPATSKEWASVCDLLDAAQLPIDDIGPNRMHDFLVALSGGGHRVVATIGLETHGNVGLLRSLVVSDAGRRQGVGAQLVAAIEEKALAAGIARLFLLTIDADRYFERQGFAVVRRDEVPEAIRATREFSELCPGDAVVMSKALAAVTTSG